MGPVPIGAKNLNEVTFPELDLPFSLLADQEFMPANCVFPAFEKEN